MEVEEPEEDDEGDEDEGEEEDEGEAAVKTEKGDGEDDEEDEDEGRPKPKRFKFKAPKGKAKKSAQQVSRKRKAQSAKDEGEPVVKITEKIIGVAREVSCPMDDQTEEPKASGRRSGLRPRSPRDSKDGKPTEKTDEAKEQPEPSEPTDTPGSAPISEPPRRGTRTHRVEIHSVPAHLQEPLHVDIPPVEPQPIPPDDSGAPPAPAEPQVYDYRNVRASQVTNYEEFVTMRDLTHTTKYQTNFAEEHNLKEPFASRAMRKGIIREPAGYLPQYERAVKDYQAQVNTYRDEYNHDDDEAGVRQCRVEWKRVQAKLKRLQALYKEHVRAQRPKSPPGFSGETHVSPTLGASDMTTPADPKFTMEGLIQALEGEYGPSIPHPQVAADAREREWEGEQIQKKLDVDKQVSVVLLPRQEVADFVPRGLPIEVAVKQAKQMAEDRKARLAAQARGEPAPGEPKPPGYGEPTEEDIVKECREITEITPEQKAALIAIINQHQQAILGRGFNTKERSEWYRTAFRRYTKGLLPHTPTWMHVHREIERERGVPPAFRSLAFNSYRCVRVMSAYRQWQSAQGIAQSPPGETTAAKRKRVTIMPLPTGPETEESRRGRMARSTTIRVRAATKVLHEGDSTTSQKEVDTTKETIPPMPKHHRKRRKVLSPKKAPPLPDQEYDAEAEDEGDNGNGEEGEDPE